MIDKEASTRLDMLRFPLIICVIFIHAHGVSTELPGGISELSNNSVTADLVRNVISQGLARTAVPIFFLMSGYLFFYNSFFSRSEYIRKVKSRSKTLLIPFLFWNILTLILIAIAQSLPQTQHFFSGKNAAILSFNFFEYINAVFGITQKPISYQFWFIRDLIIMVMAMPIIFIMCRKVPIIYVTSLLILWLLSCWPLFAPSSEALLFFSLGCALSINKKSIFSLDRYGRLFCISYVVILSLDMIYIGSFYGSIIHKAGVFMGVVAILFLTGSAARLPNLKNHLLVLSKSSFFVFAAHEPLLRVLRRISDRLIEPTSTTAVLSLYFIIPILVIISLVYFHRLLLKSAPNFTRIITGGR